MLYTNQEITKRKNIEIKLKRIVDILVYIIFIPILLYNIILIIKAIENPKETPSFLGIKTYVIVSGSMEPNIQIGDIVVVKSIKNKEEAIKVGDVISFRKGHSVITHRITNIEKDENGILRIATKGDNNNTEDSERILINNIEGKVVKVIPKIGYITVLFKDKVIIIVTFIIAYNCMMKSEKIKNRKRKRRQKRIEYEKAKNEKNYRRNENEQ